MNLHGKVIGWGVTGSFCSFEEVYPSIRLMIAEGARVIPVFSAAAATTDTRFGTSEEILAEVLKITGEKPLQTMVEVEPAGQKQLFDCFLIAPCTGNTIAKLANAITDTPVLMAAKGTLRNNKPVVVAVSTNDALGANAGNIGKLLNTKNIFMVPFGQDNPMAKPKSCVADFSLIPETVAAALEGRQVQPILQKREWRTVR
ncbi:MAG TPA: dipicolinate synthase subunit B [Firmicutes bacterium]|nr:dipicolinate synthase subunit B [Bacillota bacterium]